MEIPILVHLRRNNGVVIGYLEKKEPHIKLGIAGRIQIVEYDICWMEACYFIEDD